MINVQELPWEIIKLHENTLARWMQLDEVDLKEQDFLINIEKNHAFNHQLWLAEDQARRDDQGFEFVYHAKRAIDKFNQQRNNMMEAIDEQLIQLLNPSTKESCQVNSETPGMMIDRLSILTLKHYHMSQQLLRQDVTKEHLQTCQQKVIILARQRHQLAQCLQDLMQSVQDKTRTFKTYKQYKMYNDPNLNPALYSRSIN
jgi:hypothetical protein